MVSRISSQETKRREIFHFINLKTVKMKNIVKQVVGIDVAQDELVVCIGRMYNNWTPELYGHKNFPNTAKGFIALKGWVTKLSHPAIEVRYVMEATGVYHESLAYFLSEGGDHLSIILPNKISNYSRTLDVKTVTDKTASEAIARFGLERVLDNWEPPRGIYKKLRQLTRERDQVVQTRTVAKNQLHAEQSEAYPNKTSIARTKKHISFLDKQEQEVKQELLQLIKEHPEVKKVVIILCSVPGIGLLTAATILGETNGFDLIRNKRQLASYAGFDVKEKQSGTSVKGKSRISKRGNKYLRKAMHMPALAAIRNDERFKAIFARIVSKNGIKMKAAVAVQRKLLEMTYTVYKKQMAYDKHYLSNNGIEIVESIQLMDTKN
jgi:transposase